MIYDRVQHFNNSGYTTVELKGKYTIINKKGKQLLPDYYDNIHEIEFDYGKDLFVVFKNRKYGLYNANYIEIAPLIYDSIYYDKNRVNGHLWC